MFSAPTRRDERNGSPHVPESRLVSLIHLAAQVLSPVNTYHVFAREVPTECAISHSPHILSMNSDSIPELKLQGGTLMTEAPMCRISLEASASGEGTASLRILLMSYMTKNHQHVEPHCNRWRHVRPRCLRMLGSGGGRLPFAGTLNCHHHDLSSLHCGLPGTSRLEKSYALGITLCERSMSLLWSEHAP